MIYNPVPDYFGIYTVIFKFKFSNGLYYKKYVKYSLEYA